MNKYDVLQGALSLNGDDKKYVITVEGDSIITTVKWMDAMFFAPGSVTDEVKEYKFIAKLNDNYTWVEIDESKTIKKSLGKSGFNMSYSGFKGKEISFDRTIAFGKNRKDGTVGKIDIKFNSEEYKKPVSEYLASCGYKKTNKGFFTNKGGFTRSFCSKCGTQIESADQQFCAVCGEKIERQSSVTYAPTAINNMPVSPNQQGTFNKSSYIYPNMPMAQHPMKWYKFLVYFALIFGAIINFALGMSYITGGIYYVQTSGQVSAEAVYSTFGNGLKTLDIIYGLLLIAIAAFGIYTEFRLAKYKSNGPLCINILYGAAAGLTIFYDIALLAATGLNQLTSGTNIISVVFSVGFVLLNHYYFKKRKDLFVN